MRKHTISTVLIILMLVCLGCASAETPPGTSLSSLERQMIDMINEDRARYGLGALSVDPQLCAVARVKAEDMLKNGYFSHTSPTYGNIRKMLTTFGVSYAGASENIARSRSIAHAEAAFLSSPSGHRQTLLSSAWTRVGVGVAVTSAGFVYVSQVFARG